jgi:hypothetical protein
MTPHGTVSRYRYGCRCAPCTAANTTYARQLRANARERGFAGLTHGCRSTYDAGCKCQPCYLARKRAVSTDRPKPPAPHLATGACPVCGHPVSLVAFGRLRVHGPQAERCTGSGLRPVGEAAA